MIRNLDIGAIDLILEYINQSVFEPVCRDKLPDIRTAHIQRVAQDIAIALQGEKRIFVYGDYDMDGLCCQLVWKEIFEKLRYENVEYFRYSRRTHAVDNSIIDQVKDSRSEFVIICDTGCSASDRDIISLLWMQGCKVVVIDHHMYAGEYDEVDLRMNVFNAYEERFALGSSDVCGAYAALMVAKLVCEDYLGEVLPFNACAYALAAMYADEMDMSSEVARALYNYVAAHRSEGPMLLNSLNQWRYKYTRRFFSYIVAPKVNACFRMERFDVLNRVIKADGRYDMDHIAKDMQKVHSKAVSLVGEFAEKFSIEPYGTLELCVCNPDIQLAGMNIVNFSGLIANYFANRDKCAVITAVKNGSHYRGSYRDFFDRSLLQECSLFIEDIGGHPSAFGFEFGDLGRVRKYLKVLGAKLNQGIGEEFLTFSSSLVKNELDVNTLALYNEYMTTKPKVVISHRCDNIYCTRSTKYYKTYKVGLPLAVKSPGLVRSGQQILLEPCITRKVELRLVE